MISRDKNSTDVLKITFAMGTWKKNLSAVVSQKGKSRFEVHANLKEASDRVK